MIKYIRIILLLALVLFFSCEKNGLFVDCSQCIQDEPLETEVQAKVSIDDKNPRVKVNIYEGLLEDSILYSSYTANFMNSYTQLTVNKQYTFTATYYVNGEKYVAVDSATPRVKYEKDQCDNPCYFVYDNVVNLKLKYTK